VYSEPNSRPPVPLPRVASFFSSLPQHSNLQTCQRLNGFCLNSFLCRTYTKSARNSFPCRTYKIIRLKVLCLPHIRKKRGVGGVTVNQKFHAWETPFSRMACLSPRIERFALPGNEAKMSRTASRRHFEMECRTFFGKVRGA
jgi:hypothetical protein